uniref:Protein transport protein Sec61 subunit beta n=1 Tax=Aegilops tauschii subsp. strangulata TaxID=200361 RepID=A0A453JGJ2_AEGTS
RERKIKTSKKNALRQLPYFLPYLFAGRRRTPSRRRCRRSATDKNKMVINGDALARGSAAAAASLRRRRTTSGAAGGGGGASTMLQFYTDEAAGRKMSPNAVLIMSIGFVAVVAVLHVFGKLYR